MRLLILSITILSCWAAEAEAVKLPADVQTVIDRATTAETAAQNEADTKILKVKQALVKDLTKLQEAYTKKGNLDAANGIKAKIDATQEYLTAKILDDQSDVLKQIPTMTGDSWKALKGKEISVSMSGPASSGITIKPGETWIMVPNPDDKWGREALFDYKGNPAQANWAGSAFNGYALIWVTDDSKGAGYTITGKGAIRFQVNLGSFGGTGNIRVKLIKQ